VVWSMMETGYLRYVQAISRCCMLRTTDVLLVTVPADITVNKVQWWLHGEKATKGVPQAVQGCPQLLRMRCCMF
jgi:hypothetical protein